MSVCVCVFEIKTVHSMYGMCVCVCMYGPAEFISVV